MAAGSTDTGCHRETATGGYHCHKKDDEGNEDLLLILGGVAAGLVLVAIPSAGPKQSGAGRKPPTAAPISIWRKGAGVAAEYSVDRWQHLGVRMVSKPEEKHPTAYMGTYWQLRF